VLKECQQARLGDLILVINHQSSPTAILPIAVQITLDEIAIKRLNIPILLFPSVPSSLDQDYSNSSSYEINKH